MVNAKGQLTAIEYDSTTGTTDLLDKLDTVGVVLFLDLIRAADIPDVNSARIFDLVALTLIDDAVGVGISIGTGTVERFEG